MRCKKCGWPNKPEETYCVKCKAPLSEVPEALPSDTPAKEEEDNYQDGRSKTVSEEALINGEERINEGHIETTTLCPKCGYPVRPGTEKCPNCKFSINVSPSNPNISEGRSSIRPIPVHAPTTIPLGAHGGTRNPYLESMEITPTFQLEPIIRQNERHILPTQELEGQEVILNRSNTDEANTSITSREQALVTKIDGKWYIEDRSDMRTTFVQASSKIEIQDGDIILLGDRMFVFHEKD